jgi:hypothetical protein
MKHGTWNMKIDLVEKRFKYIQILKIDRRKIKFNLDGTIFFGKEHNPTREQKLVFRENMKI